MEPSYLEQYFLEQHEVEAQFTLLTTEEGERKIPVSSGYRGQFFYNGHDWDAQYTFGDIFGGLEPVQLGQTITMYIQFMSPQCHFGRLFPQKEFLVREGQRTIGKGHITRILPPLEVHALRNQQGSRACKREGEHCTLCHC